jgi:hypothetical protein
MDVGALSHNSVHQTALNIKKVDIALVHFFARVLNDKNPTRVGCELTNDSFCFGRANIDQPLNINGMLVDSMLPVKFDEYMIFSCLTHHP